MTRRRIGIAAALAVTVLLAGCAGEDGASDDDTLPSIELIDLAAPDETIDLAATTAAPRVINLWATWCAPCRAELPAFDEVADRAGDAIAMLGVNIGEGTEQARELIDELGVGFPQGVDPSGDVTAELRVSGLPATLFTTADGEVLHVHAGPLDADDLIRKIDEHFGVQVDA